MPLLLKIQQGIEVSVFLSLTYRIMDMVWVINLRTRIRNLLI